MRLPLRQLRKRRILRIWAGNVSNNFRSLARNSRLNLGNDVHNQLDEIEGQQWVVEASIDHFIV